jgi:AcrR family transcriptional regulator
VKRERDEDDSTGEVRPLHGGRHSVRPGALAHNQRERLINALATLVSERGYNGTTIELITETAAVSNRTFYENFSSREDCFAAAYEALDDYLAGLVGEAIAEETEWPEQVAKAARALIGFLASRPALARLYLVESVVVGEPLVELRQRSADRLTALLEPGGAERELDPARSEAVAEGLIGGILTLLGRRVAAGEAEQLESYAPAVIEFALAPYLGAEEARAVASGE